MKRLSLLLVALGLFVSGSAHAYRIDDNGNGRSLHWKNMPVRWRMVTGNVPGAAAGEEAVKRAFQSWNDSSSAVNYVFDGYSTGATAQYDRRNVVLWVHSGWSYDATALAVTVRYYSKSDGSLLDADIVFNGQRYAWSTTGVGYDIENAAAHEVGHFGGLGHSTVSGATMHASASPGETSKRTLASDDIAGITALYGGHSEGSGESSNAGGVTSSPASNVGSGSGGGCSISTTGQPALGEIPWIVLLLGGLFLRLHARRRVPYRA